MVGRYIDFVRYAVSESGEVPEGCREIDWMGFLDFCDRQGILGLVFRGIERAGLRIPQEETRFEWIGAVENIKAMNRRTDKCMMKVARFFQKKGCRSCILKGQANARMYPQPEMRTPGDIDIWVEGKREDIIRMVLDETPGAHYSIHHVEMPVFDDVPVEVHYRPIFLDNWFADRRLQRYIDRIQQKQFANCVDIGGKTIGVLTDDFNVVYLLLHMYHHFFSTRNSLKQLTDYYYQLRRGLTDGQKEECAAMMKKLKVMRYARGIFWIQREVFGLEERYMIVEPDEKTGRLIWQETLGYGMTANDKSSYLRKLLVDNRRLIGSFPSEVLVSPLFLVWHQWWKIKMRGTLNVEH